MLGISKTFDLGDGRTVTIETGKMAKQADGSAVVKVGNTMLLATVCCKKEAVENTDFMPLQVEYQEKYAAVGRFPGGFFRREARPSEYEILIARLIDRALRPLFPSDFHAETQVIVTLVSGDKNNLPDAYACLAASSALAVSNIPFSGPISEARVGRVNGQMVINPTVEEMESSDIDMIVAASMDNIMMVEGGMKEISEADMVDALNFAHEAIKKQCQVQLELAAMVEKANPKREYCHEKNDEEMRELVMKSTYDKVYAIAKSGISKHERNDAFEQILTDFITENVPEEEQEEKTPMIARYYHDVQYHAVRNMILNERVRLDSRSLEQIRPIWIETGCLPSVHGSAIFTRGETQSLTSCTLGTKLDEQTIDGAVIEGSNRFLLHYNFPPFSVGEVKRLGTGRREVGHGNLAHRALKRMLPLDDVSFPYTVRIVSDILESNGSSSMATVCAGTLALMDCGVKIKKPVSGIAMGLITDEKTGNYAILSDILGDEDHLGDMDFKVCGTADGITACQMDIKINGLSSSLMAEALEQARKGRLFILDKITEAMPAPREDYREFVPRIIQIEIPRDMIGAVIGSAGKVIQEIQRETNTIINIEEKGEVGIVDIAAPNLNDINRAIERIELIIKVPEIGETYHGVVKSIMPFGAFVEILPGTDALLHVSEIAYHRINNVEDVLKVGDEVDVKLISVDEKTGKYKLSMRALMPKPEGYVEPEARPKRSNDRDRRGGGRSSNGGGNNRNRNEGDRRENHR